MVTDWIGTRSHSEKAKDKWEFGIEKKVRNGITLKGMKSRKGACIYCKWWGNLMCLPGKEKESVAFLPVGVSVTTSSCYLLEKLRQAAFLLFWLCEDRGFPGSSFFGHRGPPSMMHIPSYYHLLLLSHLGTISVYMVM